MFKPIQYDSGKLVRIPVKTTQTVVKGDALTYDASGYYVTIAGDGGTPVTHVAMETVTTTASGEMVLAIRVGGVIFEADSEQAVSVVDVGIHCDMASKSTLDPDSVTDQLFYIESIVGGMDAAETSTKVIGWFTHSAPNTNA